MDLCITSHNCGALEMKSCSYKEVSQLGELPGNDHTARINQTTTWGRDPCCGHGDCTFGNQKSSEL